MTGSVLRSRTMGPVATRVSSPVFIGRQSELKILTEALDRAVAGTASTILIAADATDMGTLADLRSPATAELGRLVPEFGSMASPEVGTFDRPEWIQGRIF